MKAMATQHAQAGFGIVGTFFQWYGFAGFLCVKTP